MFLAGLSAAILNCHIVPFGRPVDALVSLSPVNSCHVMLPASACLLPPCMLAAAISHASVSFHSDSLDDRLDACFLRALVYVHAAPPCSCSFCPLVTARVIFFDFIYQPSGLSKTMLNMA